MNGHVITDRHGGRYTYYRCKRRSLRWDCDARHVPQKALEDAVLDEMKQQILTPDNLAAIQDEARQVWQENQGKRENERANLKRRIATLSRKMTNITNIIVDTGGSRRLLEKLQELEKQEADLLSQLARLDEQPDPVLDLNIKELSAYIIQALDLKSDGINDLLRNLIHRIEVKRKGMTIRGTIYYYSPPYAIGSAGRSRETYKHKLKVKLSQGR